MTIYALAAVDGGLHTYVNIGADPAPYRWATVVVTNQHGREIDRVHFTQASAAIKFAQDAILD